MTDNYLTLWQNRCQAKSADVSRTNQPRMPQAGIIFLHLSMGSGGGQEQL